MAKALKKLLSGAGGDDEEVERALQRDELSWGRALGFVAKRLWRHPWLVVLSLGLGVAIAVLEVLSLGLIFPFIESLSGGGGSLTGQTKLAFLVPYFEPYSTVTKIQIIAVGLVVIQVLKGGITYVAGRVASYQKVLLDRDIRMEIFDQIIDVELRFIHKEKVANLYTILHSYPREVASVGGKIVTSIPRAGSFISYVIALFLLSWELTLLALALAVTTNWIIGGVTNVIRTMTRRINVHRVRLKHISLEVLNGMKVVHLFGREPYTRDRFEDQLHTYQDNRYRKSSLTAAVNPIYTTLMTTMFAGILVAGTLLLDRSAETWVALLTMFMVVMFRLMTPTAMYAKTKASIAGKLPSMEEIIDFLERDDKPFMPDGTIEAGSIQEGIRFENVWFRYDDGEPDVIRGLDLEVPRGHTVALVGGSGAGKSTTVDLLARLYDPTQGRITVDGTNLRDLRVESWRHRLSVVSQDTFLFNDTVRENIRFGRLDATDEEVEEAARQANAHGFILELPEGYETMLGDRGVRLSGGQAQRVAIARAILANPDLLILDEATSALDTETEQKVQEAIDRVSQDRTVVAIAHRLSTIRDADEIAVLEDGRVVELGTHEQLLARRGAYWRYVQMQDLEARQVAGPVPDPLAGARLVLQVGRAVPTLRTEDEVLGPLQVVGRNGESTAEALDGTKGNVAVLRPGSARALVRFQDHVREDVPIYREVLDETGAAREARVRVSAVRGAGDPSQPSGVAEARKH